MTFCSYSIHQPSNIAQAPRKPFFQTKAIPLVNQSNDVYEQEAYVANQVMKKPDLKDNFSSFFSPKPEYIQKKLASITADKPQISRVGKPAIVQRQSPTGKEEDKSGEVLSGGIGIVASEAFKHKPLTNYLDTHLFSYLKRNFWEDRSTSEKALLVGHSLLTLAPLGTVFSTRQGRETFSGINWGSAFSWIPYNPVGGFSYDLPDSTHPTTRFHLELQADDYLSLLQDSNDRIPEMALSLSLQGEQGESGALGLTGGSLKLSIGGGIVDLQGFVNQPVSPYPILLSGTRPGDSPTWLMRSLPGIPEESWPRGTGFIFSINILQLPKLWGSQPLSGENSRPPDIDDLSGSGVMRKNKPDERGEGNNKRNSGELTDDLRQLSGTGEGLSPKEKSFYEPRFGYNFSAVKLYTSAKANESAQNINALAYTHGNHIVFGRNQYNPETDSGKKLMAHELTHVVQQSNSNLGKIMRTPDESGINESPPRYSFSTNCAWIDWGHANPGMTNRLINAVQEASDRMAATGSTVPERVFAPRMESSGGPIFLSGVTPVVHIKQVLTTDEVLQVALRIFMLQSLGFEALQNWTDAIGSSSFSEEDLSSNLIAFYMGARSFPRSTIETICDVWSSARSLSKFNGYTFNKRISFHPGSLLPSGGSWPADLSSIRPADTGGTLMDTPSALFETTFSSFSRGLGEYEMMANPSLAINSLDSGGTTIDISGTLSGSANGPHFEVRPIVPGHNLRARWMIRNAANRRYRMRGDDESFVDQYGDQLNAYINAPTREVLRDEGISNATVLCRVIVGNEGEKATLVQLLQLPVNFTW
jgi:hypothetical protein